MYYSKYIKYKTKYLILQDTNNQIGGNIKNNILYCGSKIIYNDNEIKRKNYKSTSETMYQIASCSKFITSIVVAKLYELKKLDYDTDINKYLKKWKCPTKITLRQLLTHSSGSSDHNGYLGYEPQIPIEQNLQLNIDIISGNTNFKPFNITEKPNTKYMYSGAGYQVIQQILEEITNKRLYQLMDKYIFKPLKMKKSTGKLLYEKQHKYKIAHMKMLYFMYPETAAAGVWMSCNDLLLLITDIMNGYNDDNSKILSQETIKIITTNQNPEWNYGLGLIIIDNKNSNGEIVKDFGHSGSNFAYKSMFRCIPEKKYIEIIMYNYYPKYNKNLRIEAEEILKI